MTNYQTTVIDAAGHWLRSDAAASYFRLLAAGMPAGGVDVFGRSMAQQWSVYNAYKQGHGPVAAYPNANAPHVKGIAMDFHTTHPVTDRYDPSPAYVWVSKGIDGSKRPMDTDDTGMRGHAYGWYRTVPKERWHLQYDASKDKHRAADLADRIKTLGYKDVKAFQRAHGLADDGIDGPLTWGALLNSPKPYVKPAEPEVPPVVNKIAASFNVQSKRWGGGLYKDDAAFIKNTLKPDVLFTQESDEIARTSIVNATGMKVWPLNYVAMYFDPEKFSTGPKLLVPFNASIHGVVGAELTSKDGTAKFAAASIHVRPEDAFKTKAASVTGKRADIAKAIKLLAPYKNVIIGGDFSSDARDQMQKAGYRLATPYVDTYDKAGTQHIDFIFIKGDLKFESGKVIPTSVSDHHGLKAEIIS